MFSYVFRAAFSLWSEFLRFNVSIFKEILEMKYLCRVEDMLSASGSKVNRGKNDRYPKGKISCNYENK
jgi:hypothetical protein